MLARMPLTRRDALRGTGLAAGAALIPGALTTDVALGSGRATAAKSRKKKPWYELGMMVDPVLDEVLLFYLGATWQKMADVSEVLDTANRITKDEWSWAREWTKTADRVRMHGHAVRRKGHRLSAGDTLMRASTYYRAVLHRYPAPLRPEARRLTHRANEAFAAGIELLDLPVERVRIPYERTTLPGYLYYARTKTGKRLRNAPLLIVGNGRDAWAQDGRYLGEAANDRGYHCLLVDGPGQGETLRLQRLVFRPDWEKVVTPVVDFAIAQPEVDSKRIALMGISMGGALAPRAAAFEHRLKLLIANPGVLDWSDMIDGQMRGFLGDKLVDQLDQDPRAFDAEMAKIMKRDPFMRWAVDDMEWKHGKPTPSELLFELRRYDNTPTVGQIRANTLVMDGTADLWAQAKQLYAALRTPKDYMLFTARDTGLKHVQTGAMAISTQRLFDWFDENI